MPEFSFFELFWVLLLVVSFLPMIRQRRTERNRIRMIQRVERTRGARVITLIHRQESTSLLGLLNRKFINIEDSEQVLRAIRLTRDDLPIDLILHTPGGLVLAAEQIAQALLKHPGKVTVFVPHYAMSGGTLIALAADEIRLDDNAVMGPVDPQLGNFPAASILKAIEQKDKNEIDDETLILADMARKAIDQVQETVFNILRVKMDEEKAGHIAELLTEGRWTHDYPIDCDQLRGMGLEIHCELPRGVYQLMELYPQAPQRRPSVQYIPAPYTEREPAT